MLMNPDGTGGGPENRVDERDACVSLARVVLDMAMRLRQSAGASAQEPCLRGSTITEVAISLVYDPGPGGVPMPLPLPPPMPGRARAWPWSEARDYVIAHDRQVVVDVERLRRVPAHRLARFEMRIRFQSA